MIKKFIFLVLSFLLFWFVCINPCFAYTSSELRNYVNHTCIIRIYNPETPYASYLSLRGKVIDLYSNNGQYFITIDFGYQGLQEIPIEMIVNIRDENITER